MTGDADQQAKVPAHIAVIMDGNGRWARARGLPRSAGHGKGAEAVKRTLEAAEALGVGYLTLFGFSSENWNRPDGEVGDLVGLAGAEELGAGQQHGGGGELGGARLHGGVDARLHPGAQRVALCGRLVR